VTRWSVVAALVAGAALVVALGGQAHQIRLTVTPESARLDEPFRLRVTGMAPGGIVTIAAAGRSHFANEWKVVLTAHSDSRGDVDLRDRYLLALLRPPGKPVPGDYLPWTETLSVVARAGSSSATARAHRFLVAPGVRVIRERSTSVGFTGEWLVPRGVHQHPAILLLGGSEGGVPDYPPAYMLAARGYPVLALAYFRAPGLPRTLQRIPLEYFRRALDWLRVRPQVDPRRLTTFGISRGGELSLILASTFRDLVHGAVSYVGADVAVSSPTDPQQPAWTFRGKPLGISIPVAQIDGPVFAAGGGDDALWPSGLYARSLAKELQGHDRRDVILVYPRAGHLVGLAVPNQPELSTTAISPLYGPEEFGGSPRADEAAREDSWPRLLRFLASADRR